MAIDRNKITKLAENFMATGKVERAIDEFLKLIEDSPDNFQLLNRVGDAYLQAGKVPEAIEMFKRSGGGFERGGFNSKATAVFKKAHRIVAEDLEIAEHLAELYRQTNMIKDAVQIHIEVAELFTKKGLIKRALEEFAKVVDLDPKNLKNKVKLADLYNKEGMQDRAASIYLEVAEALALEEKHLEANQILERARTMVSTPQVFLTQSRLCVIQKDLPAAAGHLRDGLVANPRSPELLDALAEVELQAHSPERALAALAEVPQLPEKSLLLCERAVRALVRSDNGEEALRLFKPIGREFARRGLGESAAKALRAGLQGNLGLEAWLQLAEMAHQGGNRGEQVECLRQAYVQAGIQNNLELAGTLSLQLQGLGVAPDQLTGSFPAAAPAALANPELFAAAPSEHTDVDPVRRLQIEQLERDGEHATRNRFADRAMECQVKILELDPANASAIERIADLHRATGVLSKVQMHYVKTAEKIAALGYKREAVELLDRAEAMFPGSTRFYRRSLGLLDVAATPAPVIPPPAPAIALPAPAIALPDPEQATPLIELDDSPRSWAHRPGSVEDVFQLPVDNLMEWPPQTPALPATAEDFNIPVWEDFQEEVPVLEPLAPAEPPAALDAPEEFDWSELSCEIPQPGLEALPLELELEPLPFPTEVPAVAEVDDNLAATLSYIDFQLDYGSPEEAKLEIEAACKSYPGHPELKQRLEQAEEALRRLGFAAVAETGQEADFAQSFFDLTDVLGDALLEIGDGEEMHDATHMVEKIQTVDELFNAFRDGVNQQVQGDDYDTHYNLGIAYKEMLLLEPAVEEFKKAMVDPERTLECCSMLSICEQAQGHLDQAIAWLEQGIGAPGFPPEDAVGLHYDLGGILQLQGRQQEAQTQFRMVHEQDPEYREVAQLLN